jgi:broad specificity phosphatase PhoE
MGDWYDSWIAGDYTPAEAEPFSVLRARAVEAINRATEHGGVPLIVAHGALFRALRAAHESSCQCSPAKCNALVARTGGRNAGCMVIDSR